MVAVFLFEYSVLLFYSYSNGEVLFVRNVGSISGHIVRHFRSNNVDKNKLLEDNLKLISNFTLEQCIGAISFTLDKICHSSADVTPVIEQTIANESAFLINTTELSGNQNQHSWFSRDVTIGAMIQLFVLTLRIAKLKDIDTTNLNTRDNKIGFMLEILTKHYGMVKFDDFIESALTKSVVYLDGCHCNMPNVFDIHDGSKGSQKDFHGYMSKIFLNDIVVKLLLNKKPYKVTLSNFIDGVYGSLQFKNSKGELFIYYGKFRLEENNFVTVDSGIVRIIGPKVSEDSILLCVYNERQQFCLPRTFYVYNIKSTENTFKMYQLSEANKIEVYVHYLMPYPDNREQWNQSINDEGCSKRVDSNTEERLNKLFLFIKEVKTNKASNK